MKCREHNITTYKLSCPHLRSLHASFVTSSDGQGILDQENKHIFNLSELVLREERILCHAL